ncbi:MAG: hypothetical protein MUP98_12690 [Candidatus Aminicenantes bacterium]|nr:hypothetical protein [Candidatus Aminicenantes bacterium]
MEIEFISKQYHPEGGTFYVSNQYAFLGDNQEGLARDDAGYLYIAQDSGGILKAKDLC